MAESVMSCDISMDSRVLDLRGSGEVPPEMAVLADPSGRRARRLRAVGRAVATLLLLWMIGLILAGLGLLPKSAVLLGSALRAPQAPSALAKLPVVPSPSASDLLPARPPSRGTVILTPVVPAPAAGTRATPFDRREPTVRDRCPPPPDAPDAPDAPEAVGRGGQDSGFRVSARGQASDEA